ncbi:MAG: serine/threonine-protein kinase [Myxococcota bacterium]
MQAYCPTCFNTIDAPTAPVCEACGQSSPMLTGRWPQDPWLGTQVRDYTVEALIGVGGFGSVYRVRHLLLEQVLAMKVLKAQLASDPRYHRDFIDEVRLLMRLNHPNIVTCYDLGRLDDGSLFVLMEWIDGRRLSAVLESDGPVAPVHVREIAAQVASALAAAHAQGVLHRDLKTDNILMRHSDRRITVIDFGIAKTLGPNTSARVLSRLVGTPMFMAPEQFNMGAEIDARLDLYQLGALMFMLLTAEPPYRSKASNLEAYLESIARQQKERYGQLGPRPSSLNPALAKDDPLLDGLTGRLLSTDRAMRPDSAEAVRGMLLHSDDTSPPEDPGMVLPSRSALDTVPPNRRDTIPDPISLASGSGPLVPSVSLGSNPTLARPSYVAVSTKAHASSAEDDDDSDALETLPSGAPERPWSPNHTLSSESQSFPDTIDHNPAHEVDPSLFTPQVPLTQEEGIDGTAQPAMRPGTGTAARRLKRTSESHPKLRRDGIQTLRASEMIASLTPPHTTEAQPTPPPPPQAPSNLPSSPPPSEPEPAGSRRRWMVLAVVLGAVVLVAVLAVIVGVWWWR